MHVCECARSEASKQHSMAMSVAQGWQPCNISLAVKCFRILYIEEHQCNTFLGEFLN